ncbi:hypothetical protein AGR56_18355 [Clostridium sp. DMHC 10]|uniref:hypothetical protein n=1 Tax=Clostridium sp. DMHC 10 TaxID=747377 RepID=UPI00069E9B59|nr:hypothetical protein [Clostridium sp. DMHC 10]KOF55772.1 hypothetical protein AGR56_18355 [Clostridium sp. DMHC 10]
MIKKLDELKKSKKIASFYTNENNTAKFSVGYIVDYNENNFVIAMISPEGKYDGFALMETRSIIRINTDSKYENKILKLIKYHKTVHENLNFKEDNFILEFLKFAQTQDYIVSIELLNSGFYDIQGYIQTIKKDSCIIKQITEYGEYDGIGFVEFSDITKICL